MATINESDAPNWQLQEQLANLRPDLGIEIREELGGGLSGANVYLVDCQLDGGSRLGVLKLASASQAEQESGATSERGRVGSVRLCPNISSSSGAPAMATG